ncbi:dehydrodolichyl diphosphate synthase complex subunit DHDDS isoform X2 [Ischnura elegans]|nr:dehydrodolichyl diphosphate synthase complex subunit DHDDS isoform X2 [Ischnura elegans]
MELAREKFQRILDEKEKLMQHGVRLRVIGNITLLPRDVQELIAKAMLITKDNSKTFLNVAFAYTAREEMVNAVRSISAGVRDGRLASSDVSEGLINSSLYTSESPDPDLVIRTSGETRFSDFLLWQLSYSCVYFTDVLWPEFSIWHLLAAIFHYQRSYTGIQDIKNLHTCESDVSDSASSFIAWLNQSRKEQIIALGGGS